MENSNGYNGRLVAPENPDQQKQSCRPSFGLSDVKLVELMDPARETKEMVFNAVDKKEVPDGRYRVGELVPIMIEGIRYSWRCAGYKGDDPYFAIEGGLLDRPGHVLGQVIAQKTLSSDSGATRQLNVVYIGVTVNGEPVTEDVEIS